MNRRRLAASLTAVTGLAAGYASTSAAAAPPTSGSFLHGLHKVATVASTVPANGDVNPYGIAVVPTSTGDLVAGDTLVSNFNNKANVQGTGTTLVEVPPTGPATMFAHLSHLGAGESCPGGVGLTTALTVLPGGWVVVGSLPSGAHGALPKGNPVGCLIVLSSTGSPVETITNKDVEGPWDLTASSTATSASLFFSNALGGDSSTDNGVPFAGDCTVVRINLALSGQTPPRVVSSTVVGKGFPWRANAAALVLAPTGLALGKTGTLYVDDTQTNSISAIPHALTRATAEVAATTTITSGGSLNAPLGLTAAPNGDLLVVNGNNGNIVEVTPQGAQVAHKTLVSDGAGDLFGLTVAPGGKGLLFTDDGSNTLKLATAG